MLTMLLQSLKAFLYPLPTLLAILLSQHTYLRVLLCIPLEYTGTDQICSIADGMHQRLRVIDDEPPRCDALLQPCHEVLAGGPRR